MSDPPPPPPPPLPSRVAVVRRSLWQLVRAGVGRPLVGGHNYAEADGPRFGSTPRSVHEISAVSTPESAPARRVDLRLRIVSFNIDHGREIERAAALFQRDPALQDAGLILLQEMEEHGTERLARALGMDFVYYPAGHHPLSSQHFGNAILVRGSIVSDDKHLLPHLGRVRGTRRIAVAATVEVHGHRVTVVNVHLATLLDASLAAQRDQILAVLDVAARAEGTVIVGGDLNRRSLGLLVERRGYQWLTRSAGATLGPFGVDHLFARGLDPKVPSMAGVARDAGGASDHRPVWSVITLGGE